VEKTDLGRPGDMVVDDVLDADDVKASGSHVGGKQQAGGVGGKALKASQPLLLLHLRVQRHRRALQKAEHVGQPPHRRHAVQEDECPPRVAPQKGIQHCVLLLQSTRHVRLRQTLSRPFSSRYVQNLQSVTLLILIQKILMQQICEPLDFSFLAVR